ncbi:MAG TPA: GAF and ANTAR domain-containing protein [Mycobacteriales bacterium]|nr:GAF and ANTAR domain-containing protein [Mycobacteriales bacterium]
MSNDPGARRLRILHQLVDSVESPVKTKRLCEVSAEVIGMSGAGIMLMSEDVPHGAVCSTDATSALIEDLQFSLGEGPCVDAFHQDRPVTEPDLANPRTPRWPAFAGPIVDAGARAIFAFPLQVGAVRLGVLDFYRTEPGELTHDQHADALVSAGIVAQALLVMQARAPEGTLSVDLEASADFKYVVHQAAGMVAAQLDVSVGQALVRLRAYSFGNERSLNDVAQDVVARKLRFGS